MKITDITITKKKRYAIFADGEFLFSAHEMSLAISHIAIGDEVTIQQLEELRCESEFLFTKERAINLLQYKTYTSKAMCDKLSRFTDRDSAEAATKRMQEIGLINDSDYAMVCARDLFNIKGFSKRRITQELKRRGIEEWDIEAALEQFVESVAEDKLYALVEKKYLKCLDTEKGRNRAVAGLARLGYSYGDIKSVLQRIADDYEIVPTEGFEE